MKEKETKNIGKKGEKKQVPSKDREEETRKNKKKKKIQPEEVPGY